MASNEKKHPPKAQKSSGAAGRKAQQTEKIVTTAPVKVTNIEFQSSFCDAVNRGLIHPTGPQSQHQPGRTGTKVQTEKTATICDKKADNEHEHANNKTHTRSEISVHGETKLLKRETTHRFEHRPMLYT